MSSDDRKFDGPNPFGSFIRTAIGLAPLGVGAYVGWRNIQSNEPVGLTGGGQDRITSAGRAAGNQLRGTLGKSQAARLKAAEEIGKKVMEADAFQKLWEEAAQRNALIQSVLSTIDDPASGLNAAEMQGIRESLVNALTDVSGKEDQIKEALKKSVMSITQSGSARVRESFVNYFDEFKGIGSQLQPPVMHMKSGVPFNILNEGQLSGLAAERYKRLTREMGGYKFKIMEVMEQDGIKGVYARIETPGSGRFIGNIPLMAGRREGVPIIRMGEDFQTAYRGQMAYGRANQIAAAMSQGKTTSLAQLRKGGIAGAAVVDAEDILADEAIRYFNKAGGLDRMWDKTLGADMRELMAAEHRALGILAGKGDQESKWFASHLQKSSAMTHAVMQVVGLEDLPKHLQDEFPQNFAGVTGFDPGVAPARYFTRSESGRIYANVGLSASNQFRYLKTGIGNDRNAFPITARDQQISGREAAFIDPSRGLGKSFNTGMNARNIEWAEAITGASNRAILLDVSKDNRLGLEGMGEAYSTRGARVRQAMTKPLLEPTEMKLASSQLLNHIMEEHAAGRTVRLSREKLMKDFNGFLGMGANGPQYLRMDPFMESIEIGISEVHNVKGKVTISVAGHLDKNIQEGVKFFGTMFKGTQKLVSHHQMGRTLRDLGFANEELANGAVKSIGVHMDDLLVTTGDMLKKAPAMLSMQMISGLGLVKQFNDPFAHISAAAAKQPFAQLNNNALSRVTGAVINELASGGVDARNAGRVLAGVWHNGDRFADSGFRVDQGALRSAIQSAFGSKAADVIASAEKGVALAASSLTAGPQPGDWGMSRGSIEPRTVKMMQQRLRTMGLAEADVSDFVADTLGRKAGMAGNLAVASALERMEASVLGVRGLASHFDAGVRRMSVDQLREALSNGRPEEAMEKLLQSVEKGVLLDLNDVGTGPGASRVKEMASRVFGGQSEIYLPGGEVLQHMRGALIKTGEVSKEIAPEYLRRVTELAHAVTGMTTSDAYAKDAERIFGDFRESATKLYTGALDAVVRGKVRGSQFVQGASYDLLNNHYLSKGQARKVKQAMRKTRGSAVFMDDRSFLSMLNDFMGGRKGNAHGAASLERFFLGMEGSRAKGSGVVSFMARHPNLSVGHVAPVQLFRHVKQTGMGGRDMAWQAFTGTKAGRDAVAALQASTGRTIGGFGDVAKLGRSRWNKKTKKMVPSKHRDAVKAFFQTMSDELGNFVTWEGGGTVFAPQVDMTLKTKEGKVYKGSPFSVSSSMFGDFDGDHYAVQMVNGKLGKKLMGVMKNKTTRDAYLAQEFQYRAMGHVMMEEAKESLNTQALAQKMDPTSIDRFRNDVLKEKGMKQVGQLDVRLNMLRTAMVAYGDKDLVNQTLALLKDVEEFAAIKGKKQKIFRDYPAKLQAAIEHLFATKGKDIGQLREVLANDIFEGSQLFKGGITLAGADADARYGDVSYITRNLNGVRLDGDQMIAAIQRSVAAAIESGRSPEMLETMARKAQALTGANAAEVFHNLAVVGGDLASSIVRGHEGDFVKAIESAAGDTMAKISAASAKLNKQALAPVALGMLGSVMLSGLMGDDGYAPEPLTMPGEVISPRVGEAIANGTLFNGPQVGPTPQDLGGPPAPRMESVINPGATYMAGQNAYQVRGEVNSAYGLGPASGMMQRMTGGGGSVTINDRRRPLTANYLDRILGDD